MHCVAKQLFCFRCLKVALCSRHDYELYQARPRCSITVLSAEGCNPIEEHQRMVDVYRVKCFKKTTVTDWLRILDETTIWRALVRCTKLLPMHWLRILAFLSRNNKECLPREKRKKMNRWRSILDMARDFNFYMGLSNNRNLFSPTSFDAFPNKGMRVLTP